MNNSNFFFYNGIRVLLGSIPFPGWSFRSFCDTVFSEYAEYAFFWEIFGGKSNVAARAGRMTSGWKTY